MQPIKEYKKYIANSSWLFSETVVGILLNFTIGILTVRYLGPDRFGVLSYSVAIISFATPFVNLGLNAMVQREFLNTPEDQDKILTTVLCLKSFAGGLLFIIITLFACFYEFQDQRVKFVLPVIASSLVFAGATTVYGSWFQSQLRAKFAVIANQVGLLIDVAIRSLSILNSLSIIYFALAKVAAKIASAIVFYSLFKKKAPLIVFSFAKFDKKLAKRLLSESWWFMMAAFSAIIYLKIDQVMLGHLMGMSELGVYSAAVRLSEGIYFVPGIIMGTYYPVIIKAKKKNRGLYQSHLQNAYNIMAAVSLPASVVIFFTSDFIVSTLYGKSFSNTASILSIHIWACIFVFWGGVLSRWFIAEGYASLALYRSLIGAVINIVLNFVLIPDFGGIGAAISTFISYGVSNFLFCFIFKKTRPCAKQMSKSLLSFFLIYSKTVIILYKHLKSAKAY